jgi:hypothetical protein
MKPPKGLAATHADRTLPWQGGWFDSTHARSSLLWRGVEAQHIVSTMRLVDSLAEQAALEAILEKSKPPLPAGAEQKHYLLATPFRYRPRHASRFRRVGALGVWYGAETVQTVCAELAYWRWRFVTDSTGLQQRELLTVHTLFRARVDGRAIDLMAAPWHQQRARWCHALDYSATQALADAARSHAVQWIRYESARDRVASGAAGPGGVCAAVLDLRALDDVNLSAQQTWHCRATQQAVRLVHGAQRFEWSF